MDANADPVGRWNRMRACHSSNARDWGRYGLVRENDEGLRFRMWLMPNCSSKGMLETFLALFIDD